MPLADKYLYGGENVLYSMTRKTLTHGQEEMAATNSRIIHASRGRYFDIGYEFLSSIERRRIIEWRWAKWAAYLLFIAALCIAISIILPQVITESSQGLSDQVNGLTQNIMPGALSPEYLPAGQSTSPYNISTLFPGFAESSFTMDLSGPTDSANTEISDVFINIGLISFAIAMLCTLAFALNVKRGIIVMTPAYTHTFIYGRKQEEESLELIRTIRSESEKVHRRSKNNTLR